MEKDNISGKRNLLKAIWASKEDREIIMHAYEQSPNKLEDNSAKVFLSNLEKRFYTEWCMSDENRFGHSYLDYHGHGFNDFVRNETHYALEREGYKWDGEKFEGVISTHYEKKRMKVLTALVERALAICKRQGSLYNNGTDDLSNIRGSLKEWIK